MSIYQFSAKNNDGVEQSLEDYKGKALLIVNTATECGFTPQYDNLQELYENHGASGFEILDFPCNQFGNQAPGSIDEIHYICSSRFGTTFPLFDKVEVLGEGAHPLFGYLTSQCGFKGFDEEHPVAAQLVAALEKLNPTYKDNDDIKWNFTKFLVNREGQVVARFEPTASIETIEEALEKVL